MNTNRQLQLASVETHAIVFLLRAHEFFSQYEKGNQVSDQKKSDQNQHSKDNLTDPEIVKLLGTDALLDLVRLESLQIPRNLRSFLAIELDRKYSTLKLSRDLLSSYERQLKKDPEFLDKIQKAVGDQLVQMMNQDPNLQKNLGEWVDKVKKINDPKTSSFERFSLISETLELLKRGGRPLLNAIKLLDFYSELRSVKKEYEQKVSQRQGKEDTFIRPHSKSFVILEEIIRRAELERLRILKYEVPPSLNKSKIDELVVNNQTDLRPK
ncbi:MAG: hypothetical protein NZT61_07825 [Deltaproteobacteria bacterium]|nr:hypothetical protein [Deltaproteobacteria bacterium]